jgi:N-acetylmuramoyl-L-alanine amidase
MFGRSVGVGVIASICIFVLFGSPSHPRVATSSPKAAILAETQTVVKQTLPRRFPEVSHNVFFGMESPKPWKTIVFHHSATTAGCAAAFDTYHRQTLGDPKGIKYHFVIDNGNGGADGLIEITDRWRHQEEAAHLFHPGNAPDSIAICLVGNFEETRPTPAQVASASKLAYVLMRRFDIPLSRVLAHRMVDEDATVCPGHNFPIDTIVQSLATWSLTNSTN